MKKLLVFAGFALLTASIYADDSVTKKTDIGDITSVSINGIGDLYITLGDRNYLSIDASSQEVLDSISVSQGGNVLSLNCEYQEARTFFDKVYDFVTFSRDSSIRYHLILKTFNKLNVNGVGDISFSDIKTNSFTLVNNGVGNVLSKNLSVEKISVVNNGLGHVILSFEPASEVKEALIDFGGTGSFEINQLNTDLLELTMSGVGKVSLTGKAKYQMLNLNGVGSYNSSYFYSDQTELTKNNIGSASINTRKLTIDMNGIGSVDVYGTPKIEIKHKSGTGKINII
jgi:hypothetical protein